MCPSNLGPIVAFGLPGDVDVIDVDRRPSGKVGLMSEVLVRERRLPGIGWRYDLPLDDGRQVLVVVAEDRGARHLSVFEERSGEPVLSVRLSAGQAAGIAALLTGARLTLLPTNPEDGQAAHTGPDRDPARTH